MNKRERRQEQGGAMKTKAQAAQFWADNPNATAREYAKFIKGEQMYKAELWTIVSGPAGTHEAWAVIMPDGAPCAFGSKKAMEEYAGRLNAAGGVLV